jgi:hypothetical protein
MHIQTPLKTLVFSLLFLSVCAGYAQGDGETGGSKSKGRSGKGFHFGLFVGSLFANKYSAGIYDGYGMDPNNPGFKNNFANSAMAQKILTEYGGGNGNPDRIAPVLGCNHQDWSFDQTDMPINMSYNAAIMVGLNMRYGITPNDALLLNVNGTKLTANGDFTIMVNNPLIGTGYSTAVRTFSIIGGEQRLVFQLGYQRLLGEADKFNFFVEGGATCTMAKFNQNQINISGLVIDLRTYYNVYGNVTQQPANLTGVGFGAFAGFGANISMSPKWTVQLVYDPSYEKINIGEAPKNTIQHTAGLRAYYLL